MTAPAPAVRARSAFEIIDASIQVFRRHYATFVMLAAIAVVPVWLALFGTGMMGAIGAVQAHPRSPTSFVMPNLGAFSFFMFCAYVWSIVANGAVMVAASDAYVHGTVSPAAALRTALGHALPMIGATIVFIAPMVLGFVLLGIGVFYMMARYFAVYPAILLEDKGPIACYHRSRDLSKGYKWRILGTMGLGWIICLVVVYTLQIVAMLLPISMVARMLMNAAVGILVTPLVWIITVVLYYDQRIRQDAFDLELMAQQLPPAQVPATS